MSPWNSSKPLSVRKDMRVICWVALIFDIHQPDLKKLIIFLNHLSKGEPACILVASFEAFARSGCGEEAGSPKR